jgi:hypothetical protein
MSDAQADSTAQAEAKAKVRRTSVAETGNPHSGEANLTTYMAGRGQGGTCRRQSAVGTDDMAALALASDNADKKNSKKTSFCTVM